MSYARLSWCDVYVFLSVYGHLECCSCALPEEASYFLATSTDEMVAHLERHRLAGHDVPDEVFEALRADQKENDRIIELVAQGVDPDEAFEQVRHG